MRKTTIRVIVPLLLVVVAGFLYLESDPGGATPSLDAMVEVHHALLGKGIVVVEGLNNLHELPSEFAFVGFPLNFRGRDGSPIRAVAVVSE